jgi:hypothetical protein
MRGNFRSLQPFHRCEGLAIVVQQRFDSLVFKVNIIAHSFFSVESLSHFASLNEQRLNGFSRAKPHFAMGKDLSRRPLR